MQRASDLIHKVIPTTWRRATWRDKHPTIKQRIVLVDNGYPVPATRGEASDLIASFQDWEES